MPGNPNPSPETRFKPGSTPNPGGMSKEIRERNARTADIASQLREAALSSAMEKLSQGLDPLAVLTPDVIRVIKDSEDRAHGTPKQSVQHGGDPDNPLPTLNVAMLSDVALKEILAAANAEPDANEG